MRGILRKKAVKLLSLGGVSASTADAPKRRSMEMYYFYVLQSRKNKKLYKGLTKDLKRRIAEHRRGDSDFTSRNGEPDLIFYEAYINKEDAKAAEEYF